MSRLPETLAQSIRTETDQGLREEIVVDRNAMIYTGGAGVLTLAAVVVDLIPDTIETLQKNNVVNSMGNTAVTLIVGGLSYLSLEAFDTFRRRFVLARQVKEGR